MSDILLLGNHRHDVECRSVFKNGLLRVYLVDDIWAVYKVIYSIKYD